MQFRKWLESFFDPEGEFNRKILENKFPELFVRFKNLNFQFDEKTSTLYVFKAIAPETMDEKDFIQIAKKYFGQAVVNPWLDLFHPIKGKQTMRSFLGPEQLEDYPAEVTFDKFATGYLDAIIKISDVEDMPRLKLYRLLDDFEQKGEQLAQEAEKAWSNSEEQKRNDMIVNRKAEFLSSKHKFPKDGDPIIVHDSKFGEVLTGYIEIFVNNMFAIYPDGRSELIGNMNQMDWLMKSGRLKRGMRGWEFR